MKKIESYPPLKAVELANKKMPEIWDAIEKTRVSMLNRNSPPWREDIYIPAWQIYESTFLNGPYHIPKEARPRALAVVLSILASWRQYKEVYRFAPEMENLLYQQADFNLPLDIPEKNKKFSLNIAGEQCTIMHMRFYCRRVSDQVRWAV